MTRAVKICLILSLSLAFLPPTASAGELDIDSLAAQFLQESGAPGVSVSVLVKGQNDPQTVSMGVACLNYDSPMNNQSIMKLGSITKVLTAVRIQMLIEEGKLTYETPLSRFFPDFPGGLDITVWHMLTHTSGLPEVLALEPFRSNMARSWTPQEQLAVLAKTPLDFPPGTAQKYSNSGYLLLGMIIEAVTGDSFNEQVINMVAKPLGMDRLKAGDDTTIGKNHGCGYSSDNNGQLRLPMMASLSSPLASGNFIGTTADIVRLVNMGRLLELNLIDNPPSGPLLLETGKLAQKMEKIVGLDFELSWQNGLATFRFTDRPLNLVGKAGMFPGFAAWFLYDPVTETAVAVATNLETKSMEAMQLAVHIFEAKQHSRQ